MNVIWKAVTEATPPFDQAVLFVDEDDETYIGALDHIDVKGLHWNEWDKDGGAREVEKVTHWAVLPPTPKEIASQAVRAGAACGEDS